MRVIVVADTHIPKRAKSLPTRLTDDLKTADLIIHAGDWQTYDVYKMLSRFGKVEGVVGNVDEPILHGHFESVCLLNIKGFRIGIVHGHGEKQTTEKRAIAAFSDTSVDCIIFGHSHIPVKKYIGDLLLFNPGSATDKRRQALFSYGVLTIGKTIQAEHVFYDSKE